MPGPDFTFGPFRLDIGKRVLWREGELVSLAPKALDQSVTSMARQLIRGSRRLGGAQLFMQGDKRR